MKKRLVAIALGAFSSLSGFSPRASRALRNVKDSTISAKEYFSVLCPPVVSLALCFGISKMFSQSTDESAKPTMGEKVVRTDESARPNVQKMKVLSNNPFYRVIPHYQWQNCNCFFLSALYTLYAPENKKMYEDIAQSGEESGLWKPGSCLLEEDQKKMSSGFVELCKLFNRQKAFNPNEAFQIIPNDMIKKSNVTQQLEMAYEEKIFGEPVNERRDDGGPYSDVISKFAINSYGSETLSVYKANRDKSIFYNIARRDGYEKEGQKGKKITSVKDFTITVPELSKTIGPDDARTVIDVSFEMDNNGKIYIENGNDYVPSGNYYLASVSTGEGHIICLQPKYRIDNNGDIKISAVLRLSCFTDEDKLYECNDINYLFRNWSNRGYTFRLVHEDFIKEHQDYYCYSGNS